MWVPCLEGTTPTQGHMVYHPLNIFLFMRYPPTAAHAVGIFFVRTREQM